MEIKNCTGIIVCLDVLPEELFVLAKGEIECAVAKTPDAKEKE